MTLVIKHNTREYKPLSAGTHLAICTMIVDLGVQDDSKFEPRAKVYFRWEIPGETVTWRDRNGHERTGPATIGKEYTRSLAPKSNLRRDLEGWRGRLFTENELRSFDVTAFLGQPCQLSIVQKDGGDRVYANVAVVMGSPKGANPKPSGELVVFDVDNWDEQAFAKLPNWLQQRINDRIVTEPQQKITQPEQARSTVAGAAEFEDGIPFAWAALIPLAGVVAYVWHAAQTVP